MSRLIELIIMNFQKNAVPLPFRAMFGIGVGALFQRHFVWRIRQMLYLKQIRYHDREYASYVRMKLNEKKKYLFNNVKHIVVYAESNNLFYNNYYKSKGFSSESLRAFDDLRRIPIVTKDILRENEKA